MKTRLASVLGDAEAARLHSALALHCLTHVRALSATRELDLEVRYDGANEREVRAWLAPAMGCDRRVRLRRQAEGDLGARLRACFASAFEDGAERAAVIGSDCPALDAPFARVALGRLCDADVVLTPAEDGGYALVGMRREASARALPALFEGVPWGSAEVLRVTLERARAAGIKVATTATLADIDRVEDLPVWKRILGEEARICESPRLSVIVPTLDEERIVEPVVTHALEQGAHEVVVADGGSTDRTRERAASAGAVVVESGRAGRAWQMNAGARATTGDVLVFLHADTRLPPRFPRLVSSALTTHGAVAGAFEFGIAEPQGLRERLIDTIGRMRCRMRDFPYGDQAPFMRASTFAELGGFPEIPTMEDYELVRRLRRMGRIMRVPEVAPTSARSWQEHGLIRATTVNVAVILGYELGVSPERLALWRRAIASRR